MRKHAAVIVILTMLGGLMLLATAALAQSSEPAPSAVYVVDQGQADGGCACSTQERAPQPLGWLSLLLAGLLLTRRRQRAR